jgi:uncharacterized protein (TIGR00251 family)
MVRWNAKCEFFVDAAMIHVSEHAQGCVIAVRAQPGARRDAVVGEYNGALKVAVTAPPDKGKANEAIAAVLCAALRVKRSEVTLLSGPASRDKRFLIRGITPERLRQRLPS